MGELSLDGRLIAIPGALPGAMVAAQEGLAMLCPAKVGAEAAWVGAAEIYAPIQLHGRLIMSAAANCSLALRLAR